MPGFCTSITLVFILGVKFFDYAVDGGNLGGPDSWEPNIGYRLKMGGIKPSGSHGSISCKFSIFLFCLKQ